MKAEEEGPHIHQRKNEEMAAAAAAAHSDDFKDPEGTSSLKESMEQIEKSREEMASKDQERRREMSALDDLLTSLYQQLEQPSTSEDERKSLWKELNTTQRKIRTIASRAVVPSGEIPAYLK